MTSLAIFEKLFSRMLNKAIRKGTLTVKFASGLERTYGNGEAPKSFIELNDTAVAREIYIDPALKFAEMYMDGRLQIKDKDLMTFLSVGKINGAKKFTTTPALIITFWRVIKRIWRRRVASETSQRNVAHHYDLDDELFELFLDEDLQYTCAYYEKTDATLEEAQLAKKRHIAAKMFLQPGQKVLDLGCGWGGTALFLAKTFDVDVTGVTLSVNQQKIGEERAAKEGLSDKVRIKLCDYRDTRGKYDRLVSIGLLEHVGPQHYDTLFSHAKSLMTKDGVFVLHSIGRAKPNLMDPPFIEKYIFPNGHIPTLSETLKAVEKSGLLIKDVEILTFHYAETLKAWRQRFHANRDKVLQLYDERFFRMWDLYLATSEVSFRDGKLVNFQIQMVKQQSQSRLTRNYIAETEEMLRAPKSK